MAKRKYPVSEEVFVPGTWTSGNTIRPFSQEKVLMTTYKENPFHGIDRYIFAFDEWAHRHDLNARGPLRWFCNWWDRRLSADRPVGEPTKEETQ